MIINTLILALALAQAPPNINYPPGFTGGAKVDHLMSVMTSVESGMLQTGPTVAPGEAGQLAWDYTVDPNRPVKFRLYVDGIVVRNFTTSDLTESVGTTPGTFTYTTNPGVLVPFTTSQLGPHVLAITAYDSRGESARLELAITVAYDTPPASPFGLRWIGSN